MTRKQSAAILRRQQPARSLTPHHDLWEPDLDRATDLVMALMAINGPSRRETHVVDYITRTLAAAGLKVDRLQSDSAHNKTPLPGEVGNLILKLPGTIRGPRRLLMAHMDTVPLCVGSRPRREGDVIRSADSRTGLGADDRAGVAVVLNTALEILRRKLPHPPLTMVWTVQEELGLQGARHGQLNLWGKPQLAFNFDGGMPEKVTIGATGAYRLKITITGLASHAGGAPENGISAASIAALAIADLVRGGWHGAIRKDHHSGTSNIGSIHGGEATNVVMPSLELRAEARSHDPKFRKQIVRAIEQAFRRAANSVTNARGARGSVDIEVSHDYEAFQLPPKQPCVLAAEAALRAVGAEPLRALSNGGLDANWLTVRGIPTVTMGCGQRNPHTASEYLDVKGFHTACRVALRLACGVEDSASIQGDAKANGATKVERTAKLNGAIKAHGVARGAASKNGSR